MLANPSIETTPRASARRLASKSVASAEASATACRVISCSRMPRTASSWRKPATTCRRAPSLLNSTRARPDSLRSHHRTSRRRTSAMLPGDGDLVGSTGHPTSVRAGNPVLANEHFHHQRMHAEAALVSVLLISISSSLANQS
ncbi:MAG: hypothetical protein AW07_01210 [Candidatus Accumulibacter sp. SK-11]|nr:MAG: hypothetical protein AW07_01210 [Candidatus Accumulibacter sp. SK-11]